LSDVLGPNSPSRFQFTAQYAPVPEGPTGVDQKEDVPPSSHLQHDVEDPEANDELVPEMVMTASLPSTGSSVTDSPTSMQESYQDQDHASPAISVQRTRSKRKRVPVGYQVDRDTGLFHYSL
jgi:hypothetical protein